MIDRRQVSVLTRLTLDAALDLTLPLCDTLTPIDSECAPMVFSAFLALRVHRYRILAGHAIFDCDSDELRID